MHQLKFLDINLEEEKIQKHRKSRYNNLAKDIKDKFNNWTEIDTKLIKIDKNNFNYIDLFAGAGGLSQGLKQAGFNKIVDVEILPFAVETLKRNFPESKHYQGDIVNFNPSEYIQDKKIHLVVGGPPCQGFSVAGKRNPEDKRNFLFKEYIRIINEVKPDYFIMENVPGIITLDGGKFFEMIMNEYKKIGYEVTVRLLEVADYGVPQLRTRAIFIGNKHKKKNYYPIKICEPNNYKTIDEAIKYLETNETIPEINHIWTKHSKEMTERISKVLPGESLYESFRDAFKRQRIGHPSMTIKENHGGTHIHYKLNRCISVREMAELQTFPKDFFFEGTHKQGFIQVGNAVAPLFSEHLGLSILKGLNEIYTI